ncbi:LPS translocon maturation chaperone LptM [Vreelandella zhuhanensis]|nr:lipoprotein [Halomonas zhuhanensis]
MRVVSGLAIFVVAMILLAGCGQKGPLYLPSPEQPSPGQPSPEQPSQESSLPAQPEQAPSTSPAVEQET